MRLLFILLLAFGSAAEAAVIGSGDAVAIAGGGGVDLVVWRDGSSGAMKAMRFSPSGAPLDAQAVTLPLPAGGTPSAAWDGSGFVVTVSGANSNTLLARLPVSGGMGYTASYGSSGPIAWSDVASKGDGTSLVVWASGSDVYASIARADGTLSVANLFFEIATPAKLVREDDSYLLAWIFDRCILSPCPPQTPAFVQRLDDLGIPIGPTGGLTLPVGGSPIWSFAEGPRAILTAAPETRPSPTTLYSFDPGQYRAARGTIRFPEALTAQSYRDGAALIGLGARIDVSPTGAPLTMNWAPLASGQRLVGVLPSSGMRVIGADSGTGAISVEAPAGDSTEVGLAAVHVSANTVWLKVDNRGPDAARTIDVWVTAPVRSISSLVSGTITRFGALTRLRFEPNLKQGAGFEIAMYFESPIDPNAFEAWALTLGTDRNATNNYVSTLAAEPEPEPEPEPPARRRLVTRP